MSKIIFFLISFSLSIAWAQTNNFTLNEAEQTALDHNSQLKVMKLERDSAQWEKLRAISGHLPHLALGGMHAWENNYQLISLNFQGSKFIMPAITPITMISAQASLTLFDGFSTIHQYQAAGLEYDAKEKDIERETLKVKTGIRTLFYQALGAQELADVTTQNIKTLDQHLSDVDSQFRGGVSTRFDILRIEVQKEDARTEKMAADDQVVVARAKLFEALNVVDDGRPLAGRLPDTFDNASVLNLKATPELRTDRDAQVLQEESRRRLAQAAYGFWMPKISVYAEKDWYNNVDSSMNLTNGDFRDEYQVGLNFSWNIFDGGASIAAQKQAAIAEQISDQKVHMLNDKIPVEFENWKRKYLLSVASYKAKVVAIKKAEESVRLARGGVRAGTRTNTEVLDAELDLMTAKAKAVRSQMDAVEALGNLELAYGQAFADVRP